MALHTGRCVHCLQWRNDINNDHVLPRSWYPDSTPENTEKWVAPSCIDCNRRLGRIEEELRLRLGFCVNPSDLAADGIYEKSLRSLDADAGRNLKDAKIRLRKRESVLRSLLHIEPGQDVAGVLPGFGRPPGTEAENVVAMTVKERDLRAITEKIVRGTSYVLDGRYIEDSDEIEFWVPNEIGAEQVDRELIKFGKTYELGPGFSLSRAMTNDSSKAAIIRVRIWGKLTLYASVMPKEAPPIVSGALHWTQEWKLR
jgi:hypothetical protein